MYSYITRIAFKTVLSDKVNRDGYGKGNKKSIRGNLNYPEIKNCNRSNTLPWKIL